MTIEQGATFSRVITWEDSEGTPINLTDYTAEAQVRRTYASDSELVAMTATITDAGAGEITLGLTAEQTEALPENSTSSVYVWDLELTSSGGQVTRLLQGTVRVSPEATK